MTAERSRGRASAGEQTTESIHGRAPAGEHTVESIRERVREAGLLDVSRTVIVMLSGGRDSVCLLDVAVAVRGAEHVHALHVNYGLRPEADAEERHCRQLCAELGVDLEVISAGGGEEVAGNMHAWAREVRYGAAQQLARRTGAAIATGHTATDQVETILYRLASSPGRRALLGMAPREGKLIRPLLGVTREQTAAYCLQRGLRWHEDLSNDDPRYARTRVRLGLVRALAAVHPAAIANVLRTAELLREETQLLEDLVDAELGDRQSIAVERLRQLPAALQRMVVVRLAERVAGTLVPQAGEHVGEIVRLAERGGLAQLHVGGLVSAVVENGELRMARISSRMG